MNVEVCDVCQIRALELFTKNNSVLSFCGHHSNKYEEILTEQQWKKITLGETK